MEKKVEIVELESGMGFQEARDIREMMIGCEGIMKVKVKSLSHIWPFVEQDSWIVAHQALPSMEFSRQEYWSGLLFLSPGGLPNPGIEPRSLTLQADSSLSEPWGKPKNIRVVSLFLLQGSSHPRNQSRVFCFTGWFFTSPTTIMVKSNESSKD